MDVEQIRQFVQIARSGTVSAAARELHLSQPAISRSLQRLEDELGSPLFDRTRNSLTLNAAGRAALPNAEEMLRAARHLCDAVNRVSERGRMLRLGSIAPAPLWYFASIIVDNMPGLILGTEMFDSEEELERAYLSGRIDAAITTRSIPGSRSVPCMHEDLFLWAPEDHPLARRTQVSCKDFVGETFLIYGQIGFWWNVHERTMPHSMIIRQDDREVWLSLMNSARHLGFTSNAPVLVRPLAAGKGIRRVAVPIADPELHIDFMLCLRDDALEDDQAREQVLRLMSTHSWLPDEHALPATGRQGMMEIE